MKYKLMSLVTVVSISILGMSGCESPQPVEPSEVSDTPTPDAGTPIVIKSTPNSPSDSPTDDTGLAIFDDTLPRELDPEKTAQAFAYYKLDNVHMVVVGELAIDKYGMTDLVTQRMKELFSEMGMRIQNARSTNLDSGDINAIRRFSTAHDADLVTVITGEASERAKFGRMLSYEAEVRATIYEADGNIVVTKEITKIGSRSSKPDRAASSALRAAADEIGPFLSEQLLRKLGQNVMTRRLTISDLSYYASATKITRWLNEQDGINNVRLLSWDENSGTARFIIYLQPAAKNNLGIYITNTPDLDVSIQDINQSGIHAIERRPK